MDKWDEYKFFAESTQFLTDKRLNASQTYLTVNTAVFAVIGFLIKDSNMTANLYSIASLPLIVVGIIVCTQWYRIISNYKSLINWRYDQLMAMEDQIENSHKMYQLEKKDFYSKSSPKKNFGFSVIEKNLPFLFMALYIIYGCILVYISIVSIAFYF